MPPKRLQSTRQSALRIPGISQYLQIGDARSLALVSRATSGAVRNKPLTSKYTADLLLMENNEHKRRAIEKLEKAFKTRGSMNFVNNTMEKFMKNLLDDGNVTTTRSYDDDFHYVKHLIEINNLEGARMLLEYAQRRPVMVDGESIVSPVNIRSYAIDTIQIPEISHERKATRSEKIRFLKYLMEHFELDTTGVLRFAVTANLPEFVELLLRDNRISPSYEVMYHSTGVYPEEIEIWAERTNNLGLSPRKQFNRFFDTRFNIIKKLLQHSDVDFSGLQRGLIETIEFIDDEDDRDIAQKMFNFLVDLDHPELDYNAALDYARQENKEYARRKLALHFAKKKVRATTGKRKAVTAFNSILRKGHTYRPGHAGELRLFAENIGKFGASRSSLRRRGKRQLLKMLRVLEGSQVPETLTVEQIIDRIFAYHGVQPRQDTPQLSIVGRRSGARSAQNVRTRSSRSGTSRSRTTRKAFSI